jgi:hypothetical protein
MTSTMAQLRNVVMGVNSDSWVPGAQIDGAASSALDAVRKPLFRRFVELVTLSSIHIYGEPSEKALKQAQRTLLRLDKLGVTGSSPVPPTSKPAEAGFPFGSLTRLNIGK